MTHPDRPTSPARESQAALQSRQSPGRTGTACLRPMLAHLAGTVLSERWLDEAKITRLSTIDDADLLRLRI
jgi:hypothetical protein